MEQFNSDLSHFDPRNPYAGDEKMPIKFHMGVVEDPTLTAEAGRPIYQDVEYITIFVSKDSIVDRPVRDSDKQRWPRQYQGWKLTGESTPGQSGTRLENWAQITRAQCEEMKYFKIFTVEQLAELPDSQSQTIMGVQRLKALAKAFVDTAKGEIPLLKMQMELEARDGVIAEMQAEVRRLTKLVENISKKAA
jgi:hypothetical protein